MTMVVFKKNIDVAEILVQIHRILLGKHKEVIEVEISMT